MYLELDINECASNPCLNDGTCTDRVNGFTCSCVPGFSGNRCETDIDECASSPCLNSGTCTDHVARYSCNCKRGFLGTNCEVDPLSITVCESQSATISCNNGRKVDVLEAMYGRQNSYTCGNDDLSCSSASSYSVVYSKCQDKASCFLQAYNNIFGDPCVGYGKYLFVKYQCIE
ncbi:fibropellin-3-like [Orbicella faveolata]|uniref:fibropellin-3-like n=1 Tax=Orbicella faveolata TaxID=48498 RepID=UPI0009E382FF|nr:fibropellin-3-like [Orbicella faveolata]